MLYFLKLREEVAGEDQVHQQVLPTDEIQKVIFDANYMSFIKEKQSDMQQHPASKQRK